MQLKACTKCKIEFPATLEYFYKNPSGKYGLTPRCKSCVNIDNKLSHEKRLKADPERIRALANARAKKSYHNDVVKSRARQREHQLSRRSDPIKGAITFSAHEAQIMRRALISVTDGELDPEFKPQWADQLSVREWKAFVVKIGQIT